MFSVHAGLFCVFYACWIILCSLCVMGYFVFSVRDGLFCFLCMLDYFLFSVRDGLFCFLCMLGCVLCA